MVTKCYYCEKNNAITTRYNQPCCRGCNSSYLIKEVESKREEFTEDELAKRYKVLLNSLSPF